MATRATALRAMVVLAAAVLVLLVVADLMRGDSVLRSAWRRLRPEPETPAERVIQEFQKERRIPERSRR